jgi:thymidylate kinase
MYAMQDIFDDRKYYHGHFGILPPLSNFLPGNKKQTKSEEKTLLDEPITLGKLPAAMMILYYSLDYLLGFFFFFKIQRRKYDLVVFDRYFYDYAIQPGPFTKDSLFYKALLIVVPKPDIIVFLKSPAEIIYKRKPELSILEISRQIKVCDEIITNFHNPCIVDNTQPKDLVVQTIRLKILEVIRNWVREKHAG